MSTESTWGVPGGCGMISHALGRRYRSETVDRPICGARRYRPTVYTPETSLHIRCLRCLRILGLHEPKEIREQLSLANGAVRLLRMVARKAAQSHESAGRSSPYRAGKKG